MRLANERGFTLVELLLSIFIFSLIMLTVVALFSKFVTFQKRAQGIQRNMEDAVYAMELMAKTLRTSSVVSCDNGGACPVPPAAANSIEIFDYSQNKCIRFYRQGANNQIRMGWTSTDLSGCDYNAIAAGTDIQMANNYLANLDFRAIKTDGAASQVGKVTISMEICSTATCAGAENDAANMQTTVSLRDYAETNP